MAPRHYADLDVWQKALTLTEAAYAESRRFPPDERFGLTIQLRRAAVSVPSNIAEGNGRGSRKEYRHFVSIAHGSLCELQTLLHVAERLRYSTPDSLKPIRTLADDVGRMLTRLRQALSP